MRMIRMPTKTVLLRPEIGKRLEHIGDLNAWGLGRLATKITRHRLGALESCYMKRVSLVIGRGLRRQHTAQKTGERRPKIGTLPTISLFVEEAISRNRL
jgi:hypothetical protein